MFTTEAASADSLTGEFSASSPFLYFSINESRAKTWEDIDKGPQLSVDSSKKRDDLGQNRREIKKKDNDKNTNHAATCQQFDRDQELFGAQVHKKQSLGRAVSFLFLLKLCSGGTVDYGKKTFAALKRIRKPLDLHAGCKIQTNSRCGMHLLNWNMGVVLFHGNSLRYFDTQPTHSHPEVTE